MSVLSLRDAYYNVRSDSPALKRDGSRFEGLPWRDAADGTEERYTPDGWVCRVYRIEGEIEVCVIAPDGESWTYS